MSNDPFIVNCAGRLTIAEAPEIRETLLTAMGQGEDVVIDCSGASEIDLTFIQLLIASRRTAAALGRNIHISAPDDAPLGAVAQRAGFAIDDVIASSRSPL